MNHRHLLPNEIDLLLDDEVGFGVTPLRTHLRDCPECRARLDDARTVFDALEELPHLAPSFDFANRVMADVPVFVPWHVAARDAIQSWLPRTRGFRITALALGSSMAAALTVAMVWIALRPDLVVFATGLLGDRIPQVVATGTREFATAVFGAQMFAAIQRSGVVGIAVSFASVLAVAGSALLGLKAVATVASRRRA